MFTTLFRALPLSALLFVVTSCTEATSVAPGQSAVVPEVHVEVEPESDDAPRVWMTTSDFVQGERILFAWDDGDLVSTRFPSDDQDSTVAVWGPDLVLFERTLGQVRFFTSDDIGSAWSTLPTRNDDGGSLNPVALAALDDTRSVLALNLSNALWVLERGQEDVAVVERVSLDAFVKPADADARVDVQDVRVVGSWLAVVLGHYHFDLSSFTLNLHGSEVLWFEVDGAPLAAQTPRRVALPWDNVRAGVAVDLEEPALWIPAVGQFAKQDAGVIKLAAGSEAPAVAISEAELGFDLDSAAVVGDCVWLVPSSAAATTLPACLDPATLRVRERAETRSDLIVPFPGGGAAFASRGDGGSLRVRSSGAAFSLGAAAFAQPPYSLASLVR